MIKSILLDLISEHALLVNNFVCMVLYICAYEVTVCIWSNDVAYINLAGFNSSSCVN